MFRPINLLRLSFCLLVILLLAACGSRQVTLNEPFTLTVGENVKVADTDLTILLDGVGREWDDQEEYVNVSLIVKTRNVGEKLLYLDTSWQIDGYIITLLSGNPFGDPPSCGLRVTRP